MERERRRALRLSKRARIRVAENASAIVGIIENWSSWQRRPEVAEKVWRAITAMAPRSTAGVDSLEAWHRRLTEIAAIGRPVSAKAQRDRDKRPR